jgi:hypothetical protein
VDNIIQAFVYTWPLWAFLAVLSGSLFVEEGIIAYSKRRAVDNPAIQ